LSAGEPTESVRYPRYEVVTQFLYYVYYPFAREYRQHLFGGETLRRDGYPTFAVTRPAAAGEFVRAVMAATPCGPELAL
jgi:hypothetical protein